MRITSLAVLVSLVALPAVAAWETVQNPNSARTTFEQGKYGITIRCERGRGFEATVYDKTLDGSAFNDVRGIMIWVQRPDGRTDRWPVDMAMEGPSMSGPLYVSDFNLDFFRYGSLFWVDAPGTGTKYLEGPMKGTGAARLAFLERCGY